MTDNDIGYNQIQEWIDDQYIEEVEQITDRDTQYHFAIYIGGAWEIRVIKQTNGGKLRVRTTGEFDPGTLSTLLTRPDLRRQLRTQISTVLTGTPGFYNYLDDDGEPCSFEEMRHIELEYPIYPDNASQHEVMSAIIQQAECLGYITECVDDLGENLKDTA